MTEQTQLGYDPISRTLVLSKGADFVQTLALADGKFFPTGTAVRLVLLDAGEQTLDTWNAVVTATEARFVVQSEFADAIPSGAKYRLYVSYSTTPSTEYLWFYGAVRRKQ
ncbi:hypothetical protein [Nocardia sp. NPDC051570]|uniref:LtfC-like domain-containing protein n=1 Tax=Nocardia sp. NPDC051570 TaxID=3364324 RepID=UPI0037946586